MNYLLHHGLQAWAQRDPDRLALVDGERRLTYGELEAASNQLANMLISTGVERGDRVGVFLDKSAEAIIGLSGAMKAGACYVPLDPTAPNARISYIIGDCDISILISSTAKQPAVAEIVADGANLTHLIIGDAAPAATEDVEVLGPSELSAQDDEAVETKLIDQDLALILYTSGSTGTPKGVMLSHRNVLAFVEWAADEFGLMADDRLSQLAPLHFDLSTFDIYAASLVGASVHLVPRSAVKFPMAVRKLLEEQEITVAYSVPSILTMLIEHAKLEPGHLPSLRTILFAGEVFPTKYLSRTMRALPHVEFANLYGPTETNVCTYYRVPAPPPEDAPPISIGKAIENVHTFVVTPEGDLATKGEVGELFVRGATVMKGYWGDAERTARTRVVDPFGGEHADYVYRTGDLVSEQPDGNYTFLGRQDNQIKSRGYRIELGDIEAALLSHPAVIECAAVAVPDELVTNIIAAFVVANEDLTQRDLASAVADRLPAYMVPETFQFLAQLPKTSTGKIDRNRLTTEASNEKATQ